MSLKRFEAYGFKSFAEKTDIIFEDGITGIVGPNGCGKSNVADAIRWVLGEQSAKQLRGKNMQDLIFSGTTERKSMGYCEASLFFDNTKRIFPLDYDEVVISRKLYRSGESEYYLNKQAARLKTISDLLRDAGLGREGYSIVGQGRMDAILNSKPADRRAIFEEAIGISKFRTRKNETERKLQRNCENMSRIADALKIYGEQLEPLRRQAEDAKRYLSLREELRRYEVNYYIYNYDNASVLRQRHQLKIIAVRDECDYTETRYKDANSEYERLLKEITLADFDIASLNKTVTEIKVAAEKRLGEFNLLTERLKALNSAHNACKNDINGAKKQLESNGTAKIQTSEKINLLTTEFDEKSLALQAYISELNELTCQIASSEEMKDAAALSALEVLDGLSQSRSRAASLLGESVTKKTRLAEIEKEEFETEGIIKSLSDGERDALSAYEKAKLTAAHYEAVCQNNQAEEKRLGQAILGLETEINRLGKLIHEKNVRLSSLKGIAERYEGFNPTVKKLMADLNKDGLQGCVSGVVANLIKVEERYETAISVALGGAVQNIVTNDETDAKRIINYLKKNNLGRVTFLPLSAVKPRRPLPADILKERGVLGVADKLVSFDCKYTNIFSSLLGGTIVAEDFDTAVALSRKYRSEYRLVTLKGELFSNTGAITGGNLDRDSNLLSCDREIKRTSGDLAQLNSDCAAREGDRGRLTFEMESLRIKIAADEKSFLESRLSLVKSEEKISGLGALTAGEKELIFKLKDEKRKIIQRLDEIEAELNECYLQIDGYAERQKELSSDGEAYRSIFESFRVKRESLSEEITVLKVRLNGISLEIKSARDEMDRLDSAEYSVKLIISEKEEASKSFTQTIAETERDIEEAVQADGADGLEVIEISLAEAENRKLSLNRAFSKCDADRAEINVELMRLKELLAKETYNLEKIDLNLEAMQEKIFEDYELTYSAALKYKEEGFDYEAAKGNIARLRNAISKIGTVNVAAIDNYAEVKEKYDDISLQLEDLTRAESDLKMILEDLTNEMTKRFNEGFEKINVNFETIFRELFGGGRAQLSIESDPELDELSYGIEIEAQPPGKKLQNILLLSGGERALTCIAILFAILRLSPMPFCVLDEIEAPLDDSNAVKVAAYLKKFAEETRFILITHKKPTMEVARNLFGVTMEERGVSKIVSVRLTDAIRDGASKAV